jgi:ABC-type bacteriocin/lantibiotic exporter with double-glycine peptidase domain
MKKRVIQTDCTLQFEMTECGAASLSILLKYYGKYVTLADLRMACCIGRDGSSAKKILVGANTYGLEGKVYKLSAEETLSSS